ncbi:hypothetical protein AB0B27_22700 [Micromonospora rifamycinica]|uniref:hypothetical protein n=1 Tax=Micromonospora rifamycinica TaxID=291594 RepID=UPI00340CFC04
MLTAQRRTLVNGGTPAVAPPRPGELLIVDRAASVQFAGERALRFRVVSVGEIVPYRAWLWLTGYVLDRHDRAVARREIFVRLDGLRPAPPSAPPPRADRGNAAARPAAPAPPPRVGSAGARSAAPARHPEPATPVRDRQRPAGRAGTGSGRG